MSSNAVRCHHRSSPVRGHRSDLPSSARAGAASRYTPMTEDDADLEEEGYEMSFDLSNGIDQSINRCVELR